MLPGIISAIVITESQEVISNLPNLFIGILAVCFTASANYSINEYLDAEQDKNHPDKKDRVAAKGLVKAGWVYLEYGILACIGIGISLLISKIFFVGITSFLLMGILYNVKPFRMKEWAYLDVLIESINNPLRFILGWSLITIHVFPPSSILLSYWMGGAFLMSLKRLAEYRHINDISKATKYRKSFIYYNENNLIVSSVFYSSSSSFFLAIFMIKYRIEFILTIPLFALLFSLYLLMAFKPNSSAMHPEKLYREKGIIAIVLIIVCAIITLFFIDIPALAILTEPINFSQ